MLGWRWVDIWWITRPTYMDMMPFIGTGTAFISAFIYPHIHKVTHCMLLLMRAFLLLTSKYVHGVSSTETFFFLTFNTFFFTGKQNECYRERGWWWWLQIYSPFHRPQKTQSVLCVPSIQRRLSRRMGHHITVYSTNSERLSQGKFLLKSDILSLYKKWIWYNRRIQILWMRYMPFLKKY